jgi:AraC family transcriptional regulator
MSDPHRDTAESYRERVMRAVVRIERDLDARPSLRSLARDACLSPFHFHRVFRAVLGEPPSEYARRLRLERAAFELRSSRRTIARIAAEAGYSRAEAFTRAFTRHFGIGPRAFRQGNAHPGTLHARDAAMRGRIEQIDAMPVAFIRHIGPYEEVPPVFERIMRWARDRAVPLRTEPLFIGVAHDDPAITPALRLRFDCCVALGGDTRPAGSIAVQRILGGRYAIALHRGPFTEIHRTYAWLAREFIPSRGVRLRRAPAVELYVTQPDLTPGDEQLTEVLLPITS